MVLNRCCRCFCLFVRASHILLVAVLRVDIGINVPLHLANETRCP